MGDLTPADGERRNARAVMLLGAARAAFGLAMLAAPSSLARVLGADRATARRLGYLTRMIGGRELALGVGTLGALRDGADVRSWIVGQALSDAGDAVAVALAARRGHVNRLPAAAIVAAGVGGAAFDVSLLRRLEAG